MYFNWNRSNPDGMKVVCW